MAEARTERTPNVGLLALMRVAADSQEWGMPYWNALWLDALLTGLAQAARTGLVRPATPVAPPTLSLVADGGQIPGGLSFDVQTFVDEFGRETAGGTSATIETGTGITDPTTAATFDTPTPAATGFAGGLLEVWYTLVDAQGGETLPSDVAEYELPYLTGGFANQVGVSLPDTPGNLGAEEAHVYIRHRGGNVVLADTVASAETGVTLDGTIENCYQTLPAANTTGATNSILITGVVGGSGSYASAVTTRFYLTRTGAAWTTGDHRLSLAGVSEWDAATATYPLEFTGASNQIVPGYPPPSSLVQAIRPLDLATETVGLLSPSSIDGTLGGIVPDAALNRELCTMLQVNEFGAQDLAEWLNLKTCLLDDFASALYTADGVTTGMQPASSAGDLDLPVAAGSAVVSGVEATYAGGVITLPNNSTRKVWWDGAALQCGAAYPGTPHAKIAVAVTAGGVITGADDETGGGTGLDTFNSVLTCPANGGYTQWYSKVISLPVSVNRLLANWRIYEQPETGATIVVAVDVDGGGGPSLTAGVSEVVAASVSLSFRVTISNQDAVTPVTIGSFGAIWEEVVA
jgi:hypothetical protein